MSDPSPELLLEIADMMDDGDPETVDARVAAIRACAEAWQKTEARLVKAEQDLETSIRVGTKHQERAELAERERDAFVAALDPEDRDVVSAMKRAQQIVLELDEARVQLREAELYSSALAAAEEELREAKAEVERLRARCDILAGDGGR